MRDALPHSKQGLLRTIRDERVAEVLRLVRVIANLADDHVVAILDNILGNLHRVYRAALHQCEVALVGPLPIELRIAALDRMLGEIVLGLTIEVQAHIIVDHVGHGREVARHRQVHSRHTIQRAHLHPQFLQGEGLHKRMDDPRIVPRLLLAIHEGVEQLRAELHHIVVASLRCIPLLGVEARVEGYIIVGMDLSPSRLLALIVSDVGLEDMRKYIVSLRLSAQYLLERLQLLHEGSLSLRARCGDVYQ